MNLCKLLLVLMAGSCAIGCGQTKGDKLKAAEVAFRLEAEKVAWYGPARETLHHHILKWHREKGTPVPSAHELSLFVGAPLRFTVGGGKYAVRKQLDWSDIKLKPVCADPKDKRFYTYEIEIVGIEGRTGVEGLKETAKE